MANTNTRLKSTARMTSTSVKARASHVRGFERRLFWATCLKSELSLTGGLRLLMRDAGLQGLLLGGLRGTRHKRLRIAEQSGQLK